MSVKNTNNATRAGILISYYIVFTFWAAQGLGMSMLTRNVGGSTKKSVRNDSFFMMYQTI